MERIFCITCWLLGRRRNERVHDGNTLTGAEALAEIYGVARCMLKSDKLKQTPPTLVWSNSDLEWNRDGMSRYFEVCVDGAYSMSSGLSGCGGVIMEHTGGMIEAFTCGIKARNSLEAELWGCICGLKRAWNLDFKICKLRTDALEVLELLKKNEYERHESMELIRELKMLLAKD